MLTLSNNTILFLIPLFTFIAVLTTARAYGQDKVGSLNSPFKDYSGCQPNCHCTLQIRFDTDWAGTCGTDSTTVDGYGNKDFNFSCSNTCYAIFQKKGEGFLTLNIVQSVSHIVPLDAIIRNGVFRELLIEKKQFTYWNNILLKMSCILDHIGAYLFRRDCSSH
jgi:hypothetical protein